MFCSLQAIWNGVTFIGQGKQYQNRAEVKAIAVWVKELVWLFEQSDL